MQMGLEISISRNYWLLERIDLSQISFFFFFHVLSPFWKDVVSVSNLLFIGASQIIGDGRTINLWHDTWNDNCPLSCQFPLVFVKVKNDMLAQV
jgi:hypothetical protein